MAVTAVNFCLASKAWSKSHRHPVGHGAEDGNGVRKWGHNWQWVCRESKRPRMESALDSCLSQKVSLGSDDNTSAMKNFMFSLGSDFILDPHNSYWVGHKERQEKEKLTPPHFSTEYFQPQVEVSGGIGIYMSGVWSHKTALEYLLLQKVTVISGLSVLRRVMLSDISSRDGVN